LWSGGVVVEWYYVYFSCSSVFLSLSSRRKGSCEGEIDGDLWGYVTLHIVREQWNEGLREGIAEYEFRANNKELWRQPLEQSQRPLVFD